MERKCGVDVNTSSGGGLFPKREWGGEKGVRWILRYINHPRHFSVMKHAQSPVLSRGKIPHTVNNCAMHTDKTNPTSDHNDLKHSGFTRPSRSIFSAVNPNPLSVSAKEPSNEPWLDCGGDGGSTVGGLLANGGGDCAALASTVRSDPFSIMFIRLY